MSYLQYGFFTIVIQEEKNRDAGNAGKTDDDIHLEQVNDYGII